MSYNKGFTLIELVMVIVLLGILSAVALPRFADFGSDARAATIQGVAGAMKSGFEIAKSKWNIDGGGATVDLGNGAIQINSLGCPIPIANLSTSNEPSNAQIATFYNALMETALPDGWTAASDTAFNHYNIQIDAAPDPGNCKVRVGWTVDADECVITPVTTGC